MRNKPSYPVQIFWSDEDEGYVALVPDLPGCSAFGETAEEALHESDGAIEAWLDAAKAAGNPMPQPSQPPLHRKHSGKLLVRMPQTLHAELVVQAEQENISLNQYVVYLLTEGSSRKQYFASYFNLRSVSGLSNVFAPTFWTAIHGFNTAYIGANLPVVEATWGSEMKGALTFESGFAGTSNFVVPGRKTIVQGVAND
jgi:predicted RNase H-like HicB family nuclease